jgi:hypothetical protein
MSTTLIIVIFGFVLIVLISVLVAAWRHRAEPADFVFIKDAVVPVSIPVVVVIVGFVFTYQSEKQQEAEQRTAAMREFFISQERRDLSFLAAVDRQLAIHLIRFREDKNDDYKAFDEEAIFFFYGLHREELVNLSASKGRVVFPRPWIGEAFSRLERDTKEVLGTNDFDTNISPEGEAVMYKYFGNTSVDDSKSSVATPLLIDFHTYIAKTNALKSTPGKDDDLNTEFQNFKGRFEKIDATDTMKLVEDISGMKGLILYCERDILGDWYDESNGFEIPPKMPTDAPEEFMENFLAAPSLGTEAWNRIREISKAQPTR